MIEGRPELMAAIRPLLEARNAVEQQVSELDRKVMKLAPMMRGPPDDRTWGRPITALCSRQRLTIHTVARSRSVGAYVANQ